MLFDFHTHLFPDQLAPKALPKLAATFGANPFTDGTVSGTRAAFQQWGITGEMCIRDRCFHCSAHKVGWICRIWGV